ncbi:MAG TPA: MotA/TolQ/ExbB proton channel family protein [Azospirillum sp.]|nr:MotA/TolQ/ExbB proton channel family protein [Azospirillum sp.]
MTSIDTDVDTAAALIDQPAVRKDPQSFLLKSKFLVFNGTAVAGVVAAWIAGWIQQVHKADETGMAYVVAGTFLAGLGLSGWRLWKIADEMDRLKEGRGRVRRFASERALELKLFARISHVRHIANSVMLMGLMGTVLGLIHGLLGIKGASIGDATAAAEVISGLISGMGTALYLSLVALVLSLWLNSNFQMLRTATANLAAEIIERTRT